MYICVLLELVKNKARICIENGAYHCISLGANTAKSCSHEGHVIF